MSTGNKIDLFFTEVDKVFIETVMDYSKNEDYGKTLIKQHIILRCK